MILIDLALLAIWLYGLYLASQHMSSDRWGIGLLGYWITLSIPVLWACYELQAGRYGLVVMVVAFGCFYTASLCVWLRRRHTNYRGDDED